MPRADLNHHLLEAILTDLSHLSFDPTFLVSENYDPVAGGYGTVTVSKLPGAIDPATRSEFLVAVKTLRPVGNHLERSLLAFSLARELKVWQSLDHPNILHLVGFYLNQDRTEAQLFSPFIRYGHIEEYICQEDPSLEKCIDLASDVANGLCYLHTLTPPICHGDIKTRNILVNERLQAVICDFGVAKALDDPDVPSGLTTTDSFKGSVRYYSYELVVAQVPRKSLKSDIWAYGCVLLEMFFRTIPYAHYLKEPQLYVAIAKGVRPSMDADLDPEPFDGLRDLLQGCWNLEPDMRPDARDIWLTLREASAQLRSSSWSSPGTSVSSSLRTSAFSNSFQSIPSPPVPEAYRGLLTFTQFNPIQQPRECHVRTVVRCSLDNVRSLWPLALHIFPANYRRIPPGGISSVLPSWPFAIFTVDVDLDYRDEDPYDTTMETGPIHFWELWETLAKSRSYAFSYVEGHAGLLGVFIIYSIASPTTKRKSLEAVYFRSGSTTAPSTPEGRRAKTAHFGTMYGSLL
ncbi:hypothetical protein FRB90_006706 [Tulasnella sp. 427]|nr:hypothetical protein FRB90_006706 [Tulasnella sp. 427]